MKTHKYFIWYDDGDISHPFQRTVVSTDDKDPVEVARFALEGFGYSAEETEVAKLTTERPVGEDGNHPMMYIAPHEDFQDDGPHDGSTKIWRLEPERRKCGS